MVWGADCSIDEHIRSYGLYCFGGGIHKDGGLSYHVYNEDKSFDVYLSEDEWKNVIHIYKKWKYKNRKEKLKTLKNV